MEKSIGSTCEMGFGSIHRYLVLLFYLSMTAVMQGQDSLEWFFTKEEHLVLFELDEHRVDSIPDRIFNNLKYYVNHFPDGLIRLEGRTDYYASESYNIRLAKRRVRAVKKVLTKRGIPPDRFTESIYGETDPLASNETSEGRQINRSVRIRFGFYHAADKLKGRVVSDSTGKGVSVKLFIESRYHFDTLRTKRDGSFMTRVPAGEIFSIEGYGDAHVMEEEFVNLADHPPDLGTLTAKPMRPGKIFHFTDILFEGGKALIIERCKRLLPRLSVLIAEAPEFRFEVQGHVNMPNFPPQPKDSWGYDLSKKRAKKIYNYLVESGIDSSRLEWNAYSNWRMIHPDPKNEQEYQINRRVSIKVLGYYRPGE